MKGLFPFECPAGTTSRLQRCNCRLPGCRSSQALRMSLKVGDLVLVVLRNGDEEIPVTGWAVDTVEGDVVIGTDASGW